MTRSAVGRIEWYLIAFVWIVFTFGGWAISGATFWWQLQQPSPKVLTPLVAQGCTSVKWMPPPDSL